MNSRLAHVIGLAVALMFVPALTHAEVKRIEVTSRTDVQNGAAFGNSGAVRKAPRQGVFRPRPAATRATRPSSTSTRRRETPREKWSSRPTSRSSSRRTHRAATACSSSTSSTVAGAWRWATSIAPTRDGDIGDGFLMREGYTIVAVGWQFDVADGRDRARSRRLPPTTASRSSDRISTWFIPNQATNTFSFGGNSVYAPVDPASAGHRLTEREGFYGAPTPIAARELAASHAWWTERSGDRRSCL